MEHDTEIYIKEAKNENMDLIQMPWLYDRAAGRLKWYLAALVVISVGESRNRHIKAEIIINLKVAELLGYDVFSSVTIDA